MAIEGESTGACSRLSVLTDFATLPVGGAGRGLNTTTTTQRPDLFPVAGSGSGTVRT